MSDVNLVIDSTADIALSVENSSALDLSIANINAINLEIKSNPINLAIESNPVNLELALVGAQGAAAQNLKSLFMLAPNSTEDIVIFFTDAAIEITKLIIVPTGGGSIDWNILSSSTRAGAGTNLFSADENNSAMETFTTFDNELISANKFLRFILSAKTGTITDLHLTLFYNLTQE